MASTYPSTLDSLATNKSNATVAVSDHPTHHNDMADAINKIEAELGTNPKSIYATVKARLDALEASVVVPVPSGAIVAFGGGAAPSGWLLCDGSSVLRTTYANLFTAIGTSYGSADGSHFTLPDLRGRVPAGVDGGVGRITANNTLGATSGAQTTTLATTNLPSHNHSFSDSGTTGSGGSHGHGVLASTGSAGAHTHDVYISNDPLIIQQGGGGSSNPNAILSLSHDGVTTSAGAHTHVVTGATDTQASHTHSFSTSGTTGSAGSGTAFNHLPPNQIVNYIIKT